MAIVIGKPGILTTVQDLGRTGYRSSGINPGGVMDRTATRIVNILLGNDENEAVIEMHFPAAEIIFEDPADFAVGGADLKPTLNASPIPNWRVSHAEAGDVLRFSGKRLGTRAYLAVKGGFRVDHWLGSASTNLKAHVGGFGGRALRSGDRLETGAPSVGHETGRPYSVSSRMLPLYRPFPTVRVIAGAEYQSLTAAGKQTLVEENFVVGRDSDRMGFRLQGEPIGPESPVELVSSAATFGTIQLLPDGQLVLLMADHQTSGGYPRLANVISVDLPLVAQLGPGDKVGFHLVTPEKAEELLIEFEHDISLLKAACSFKW